MEKRSRTRLRESDEEANWDIWVKQIETGQPVNRTADYAGRDCCPSWSPDGNAIAFWSDRAGGGYFVMSAVGGRARKVIASTGWPADAQFNAPQWSAGGEELGWGGSGLGGCFHRHFLDEHPALPAYCASRTRGSRKTHLAWSPDGRFFAVVDGGYGRDAMPLWLFRDGDGGSFAVTDGTTKVFSPRFSKDGRALYYVSNRDGSMDLWRQRLASDGEPEDAAQPLTVGVGMRSATFSPDGSRLAYSKGRLVVNVWRVSYPRESSGNLARRRATDVRSSLNRVLRRVPRRRAPFVSTPTGVATWISG